MPSIYIPPKPSDLKFPEKFTEWRNNQQDFIYTMVRSGTRVVLPCAPTGFGKSPAYVAGAITSGGRTCFVTRTKGLQDQLMGDFAGVGLVDIRGKANYQCCARPGWTCQDGHAGGCAAKGTVACSYTRAYNRAVTSPLVTTSYKFWVAIHKYGIGMGKFDRVVFDEAHHAPQELADAVQVKLSFNEIQDILGLDFPGGADGARWKEWAGGARAVATAACLRMQRQIDQARADAKISWIREYHHLRHLTQKLATVALMRANDWVWEEQEWGWQFDPVRFGRYAERFLLLGVPKIIMVSATVRPKTAYMLGIGNDSLTFRDYPSVWDPRRSPLIHVPTMRVDYRNPDHRPLVFRIDQILQNRLNIKGTIHVTSFKYRDEIVCQSEFRRLLQSHWNGDPVAAAVERFKTSAAPAFLVSPSISTGYDFMGPLCRLQILTKIPFPPNHSKVAKAREEMDPDLGPYEAAQGIGQAVGRGDRSPEDWCENLILDDHWRDWFYRRYAHFVPKAVQQRVVWADRIPQPLWFN